MAKQIQLTRKELYELVWSKPMVQIAKEFNLSDVGLAKICKKFNIPRPGVGYWAKLRSGKPVHKTSLPEKAEDFEIVINLDAETKQFTPLSTIDNRKAESLKKKYYANTTLRHPHPLISKAKNAFESKQHKHWTDTLSIDVSKKQQHRSLCILNTVFKYLEQRGHKIEIDRETSRTTCLFVRIKRFQVGIRIREKYKQVPRELAASKPMDNKKYGYSYGNKCDFVYEGNLVFQIIDPFFIKNTEITDGKRKKLEDKIGVILLKILQEAKGQLEWNIQKKKNEKEQQKRWLLEQEMFKKQREEEEKINHLKRQAENWRESRHIREYLIAAENYVIQKRGGYDEGSEFDLWMKWAHSYADRIDPLKPSDDE